MSIGEIRVIIFVGQESARKLAIFFINSYCLLASILSSINNVIVSTLNIKEVMQKMFRLFVEANLAEQITVMANYGRTFITSGFFATAFNSMR
jgi:hypothetical protein